MLTFAQFLQTIPTDFEKLAEQFNAFTRARKIRSPQELLQVVMLYCGLDFSLRTCAGQIANNRGYISDMGIKKRLEKCVPWLKALLAEMFNIPSLSDAKRLVVVDGSTIQEPGATSTTYRLHVGINLQTMTLCDATVTRAREGEHLQHYQLETGDVVMMDRGYNQPKSLLPVIQAGCDVILRYNPRGMKLYDEANNAIDCYTLLQHAPRREHAFSASLQHESESAEVLLIAIPLPKQQAEKARHRLRKKAKKQQRGTPSKEALFFCGWVLIVTTIRTRDTQTLSALYRLRWQVELSIKRLKSLMGVDKLRAFAEGRLSDAYLYGKLLYATVVETLSHRLVSMDMFKNRDLSPWRPNQLISQQLHLVFASCFPARARYRADAIRSLSERPRRRRLQRLPASVVAFLCREESSLCSA